MSRVIHMKGSGIIKEALAGVASILPGHRLDLSSTAGDVVLGGAGAATNGRRIAIAVENSEIGGNITDAYADNQQVKYVVPHRGDEVQVRAAVGLTWAIGDPLYAAANGQVTDVAGTAVMPIGYALSAVTTSTADLLVPMEVA